MHQLERFDEAKQPLQVFWLVIVFIGGAFRRAKGQLLLKLRAERGAIE